MLVSGGTKPAIKLWDVSSGRLVAKLEGHTGQVADLAISQDGTTWASADRDKQVLIWRADSLGVFP
jgi:WD40 repeat protein